MLTIHMIMDDVDNGHTVVTFKANARDALNICYSYCSGIQAKTHMTIIESANHITGTAGELIRGRSGQRMIDQLLDNRFATV